MEDKEFILESARNLKRLEESPRRVADDSADMNRDELIRLIIYLQERLEETDLARRESDRKSAELSDKFTGLLRKSNEATSAMSVQMSGLTGQLREERKESAKLRDEVKAGREHLFGKKSQKGTKSKDDDNRTTPHTDVEEGFDGTPESLPDNLDVDVETGTAGTGSQPSTPQKECRIYRLGKIYRTMDAETTCTTRVTWASCPKGLS